MSNDNLLAERRSKDLFFRISDDSPLNDAQKAAFTGLNYYDPDPTLDLTLTAEPLEPDEQSTILIETTTHELRRYRRFGRVRFTVDGVPVALTLYETPHGFFLPFVDAGAGTETYAAGRYLDPEYLGNGRFHIDFNLAYNPYCAYSPEWSCPLTPPENRLPVHIRAGEKIPTGPWVETE
ncbi:MAG: DUF1684 domain-containing protein [Candidatus Flexifilum sp.]|jgi:uncharacterized protein (DUF1684 family)